MQARICCFVSWRAPANTFYFLSGWQTVKIRGAQSDFGMLVSSRCVWVCVVKNALCFQGQCFFRQLQHVWNDARELAQTCTARVWLDRPDCHENLIWDIQIPGMTDAQDSYTLSLFYQSLIHRQMYMNGFHSGSIWHRKVPFTSSLLRE